MRTADGILLGFSYLALVLVVGNFAWWVYVWPRGLAYRLVPRLVWSGLVLAAVTAIGQLLIVMDVTDTGPLAAVASRTGTALLLRLALAALIGAWVWQLTRGAARPAEAASASASPEPPPAEPVRPSAGTPPDSMPAAPAPAPTAGRKLHFNQVLAGGQDWWTEAELEPARTVVERQYVPFDQLLADGQDWWPDPEPAEAVVDAPRRGSLFGGLLLVLFAATWVLPGRAVVHYYVGIKAPLAVLHVVAVSVWLAGLLALVLILLPTVDIEQLEDTFPRLTRVVTVALATVVVTGAVTAGGDAHGGHSLAHSDYGRILLAKVVLLVVMVLVGSLGRRFANQRVADIAVGVRAPLQIVCLTIGVELMLGALALGASAWLAFATT